MFINIELVKTKKGVKNGLKYQTKNGRGEILFGSPEMVKHWATTSNNERAKAYSILISFKENKAELERKLAGRGYTLEDLTEDIEKLLFAGYSKEELAYSMIAHSDTKHFHIHTYVSNNFAGTGKSLKFWFHERDLAAIREYISLKYGLDIQTSTKAGRTRKVGSSHWKGEAKKREEIKDSIHEIIMGDVIDGYIKDNSQVRERLKLITELSGVSLKEYKNAISIVKKDGYKITLKNGIYRENWTAQKNILEMEQQLLDNLIRYLERRISETNQKYKKEREKKQGYQEEILGERFLNTLKKKKAQRQQNQQTQNQQNQNQQPQKQPQSQKQPANQNQKQTQQPQNQQKQPTRDNQQEQDYIEDYTPRPKMGM
jgi:hypothetical protein